MKKLKLRNGYLYLCDYNIIINKEIMPIISQYFRSNPPKLFHLNKIDTEIIKNFFLPGINQIVFEMTRSCNLSCLYCSYGEHYEYNRKESNSDLSIETIVKALHLVANIVSAKEKKELSINFYGGEPLLKFGVIKEAVKHSKQIFHGWKIDFYITTNGTIFTDEIIDFLRENEFNILISLDGPKDNHNKKRITKKGNGSFDIVWENIAKIKNNNSGYFKKRVSFAAVYSKDLSLVETCEFFSSSKLIEENPVRLSFVNERYSKYYNIHPYDANRFREERSTVLTAFRTGRYSIEKRTGIFNKLKGSAFEKLLLNDTFSSLAGTCHISKVYVDVNGNFHFCERINHKYPIGNVDTGFDIDGIQKYYHNFIELVDRHCSKCEVKFLCSPCFVHFSKQGKLVVDKDFCRDRRNEIVKWLEEFVRTNEIKEGEQDRSGKGTNTKAFHQFVLKEKGAVNSLLLNILKGDFYLVGNDILDKFENQDFIGIEAFIEFAEKEGLIANFPKSNWIPRFNLNDIKEFKKRKRAQFENISIVLEIEDGIDVEQVTHFFSTINIATVKYYGKNDIGKRFSPDVRIEYHEKNFKKCTENVTVNGEFRVFTRDIFFSNMVSNSCWDKKIAVTKDGKVRPCIYSNIVVGDLNLDSPGDILRKIKFYWDITKDCVEICKTCELKYACFDCREISFREYGNVYAPNPYCQYIPTEGKWRNCGSKYNNRKHEVDK